VLLVRFGERRGCEDLTVWTQLSFMGVFIGEGDVLDAPSRAYEVHIDPGAPNVTQILITRLLFTHAEGSLNSVGIAWARLSENIYHITTTHAEIGGKNFMKEKNGGWAHFSWDLAALLVGLWASFGIGESPDCDLVGFSSYFSGSRVVLRHKRVIQSHQHFPARESMDRRQMNSLQHSSEVVKAQHVYFEMAQKGQRTTRKSP
jgi:hypothetical protein